ncbi:hypothetical protein PG994_010022 [Apiospora phragmitis]|uniref:Sulfatase-modifying factor enzyme domain-containing protein n=1 Tax=Apiospora phragmitis TaxID=2905665 RepID=A0ABR1TPA9_9PEZI
MHIRRSRSSTCDLVQPLTHRGTENVFEWVNDTWGKGVLEDGGTTPWITFTYRQYERSHCTPLELVRSAAAEADGT